MTRQTLTRREALLSIGVAGAATVGGLSAIQRVAATGSGEAELTINGTIPSGTSIDATVEEYDTESSSTAINTQTISTSSIGTEVYDGLEGNGDYYYEVELALNGDGSATPEIDTPLTFEVPPSDPDDFAFTNYTNSKEWRAKPDDVEIHWDGYRLWKYQPLLKMDATTRKRFDGLYGYVATSDEKDTDVMCYWSKTETVKSLPAGNQNLSSNVGDHDPIYVFVNNETGEVDRIVYSGYNLDAAEVQPSEDQLKQDRVGSPTHATFTVVSGWHHYRHTPDNIGHFVELKSWPEVRETWLNNNFSLDAAAVENPWELQNQSDWRSDDGLVSLTGIWLGIGEKLGWYGAENTDDLRG